MFSGIAESRCAATMSASEAIAACTLAGSAPSEFEASKVAPCPRAVPLTPRRRIEEPLEPIELQRRVSALVALLVLNAAKGSEASRRNLELMWRSSPSPRFQPLLLTVAPANIRR